MHIGASPREVATIAGCYIVAVAFPTARPLFFAVCFYCETTCGKVLIIPPPSNIVANTIPFFAPAPIVQAFRAFHAGGQWIRDFIVCGNAYIAVFGVFVFGMRRSRNVIRNR
ncbi:hypothetical protein QE152_g19006 [Popillia japonica]|uniref:ABC-2 type transporter domain-containing protein n=1 Tax=Popillia japonica TaxID=7064 RepID=A0AAW1L1P4_POPJA